MEPIVQIWSSPADAGRWVQEVIGDKRVVLQGANVPPETIPGKGLRPKVEELEITIGEALVEAALCSQFSLRTARQAVAGEHQDRKPCHSG